LYEYEGLNVWGVRETNGRCPAEEFLEGLPTATARAQLRKRMQMLLEKGYIANVHLFRFLQVEGSPRVGEMKADDGPGYRLYCIPDGRNWWATHGRRKPPSDRRVAGEAVRARRIFAGRGR
jgi:putative component of toxin-antitoxin plasmid stabilization module